MNNRDEEIKKGVIDSLYWDGRVDASNVNVDIHDQRVTLRGSVASYSASEAALFDAWRVPGVTKVDNQLLVRFPSQARLPSDEQIRSNVKNMLLWNESTRDQDIDVKVKNGTVELEGSVDAYWRKLRAEQIVKDATGVVGITDRLAVVPTKAILDNVIAEDITNAIDRDYAVRIDDIDVRVQDGKVTLSGKLPNRSAIDAALDAASNTFGVKEVVDRLVIE